MKLRKVLSLLLAVSMLAVLFAACAAPAADPSPAATPSGAASPAATDATPAPAKVEDVALRVWAPENQIQKGTMDKMIEAFKAAHPEWNLTFTVEAQGEDTAKDSILKDVAAAGDVYFFANDQISELINAGAIAKLGGSTADMVKNTMPETVASTVTVDGSVYAIPFTHNTFFMYYDKSLLSEEDVKSMETIMAKPTADNVFNFCFDDAGGWKLGAWYWGAGSTIYGPTSNDFAAGCDWSNPTGVAVTNYIIDLLGNKKCAYINDVNVPELVGSHRLGAWFDGSWNYNLYHDAIGDDLGVAVLPTFSPEGTPKQLKGFYGSKAIGVNPQAKNPAAAVAFAAFLGSEEMQVLRFEETAQVPTNMNAGASASVQADMVASVIMKEAEVASIMQPFSAEFSSRYWSNAAALMGDIKGGVITKANAKEKLDLFAASLAVS